MTVIGFSRPKNPGLISRVIMRLTGSNVSHTFFAYFDTDWHQMMVLEASDFGFRLLSMTKFREGNTLVWMDNFKIERGVQKLVDVYLGTGYDFGGLFGMSLVLLGKIARRKIMNPFHSTRAVFCSEAAVLALQESNYPGSDLLVAQNTTPVELLTFLQNAPRAR